MKRYTLMEDQWNRIKDLLPGNPGDVGVKVKDNQPVCGGCFIPLARKNSVERSSERFGDF
ncbi:hypothetical protein K737_300332 [Holospora undulata HU1]|uniref:Uncharacterized protein n=1 Tax=Holospora undulata HU1 TaxID=1321371 RepID=A0A061JGM5_9PROT|nr:hypothetical protein [Holospora undulata]ETZ05235.1 hypothetical protein K737_300332 [Holospora undulata HU1]